MKKRTKLLCLLLCTFFVACAFLGCANRECVIETIEDTHKTYAQSLNVAQTEEEEKPPFNIPLVLNNNIKETEVLFKITEQTSTKKDFNYPTTSLPNEITFAKPLTITFADISLEDEDDKGYGFSENLQGEFNIEELDNQNDIFEIIKVELVWGYYTGITINPLDSMIVYEKETQTTNLSKTFNIDSPFITNGYCIEVKITTANTRIVNNVITPITFSTKFDIRYYTTKNINIENTLTNKYSAQLPMFSWKIFKKDNLGIISPETTVEPICNEIFSSVYLEYSTVNIITDDPETTDIVEETDIGLSKIRINGTIYNVLPYNNPDDPADPNNGKKIINFTTSGDYTIDILANEYYEGIDKEYTCKSYTFTIDNQQNIVAYSDKDGSEILNFESTRYQFVSSSVTLKFWGLEAGETITFNHKPAFGGSLKTNSFTLTEDILENGYKLKANGEYTINPNPNDQTISKSLKFAICSEILTEEEKVAIEEKLDSFKTLTEDGVTPTASEDETEQEITYTYSTQTKIPNTQYINTYTVSGLSLQFNVNPNVVTPSSYKYNFTVNFASTPTINMTPQLANGRSTTSNITIEKPSAAGNWKLEVKYGNTVKTYYSNNFDKVSISENGRYTVTLTDQTGQEVRITFAKSFKMNAASVILIIVGVLGTTFMVIAILKSRFTLQVK